jgi:hypothetical protein
MRRDRSPLLSLLLFAVLLAPTGIAFAQSSPASPASPGTAVEPKTADEYALEGRKLAMQPGRLLDARAALLTAWSMKQSYDTAGNLGSVEYELGMMRDAAEHLAFCARNFPAVRDQAQTEKLTRVEELLAKARREVGSMRVRVTDSDGVELTGVEILVDGKAVGLTPLPDEVFVEPGPRVISARQTGYVSGEKRIEAAKGGAESVTIVLASARDASKAPPGGADKAVTAKKSGAVIAAGAGAAAAFIGVGVGFHLASNAKSQDATATWEELRGAGNNRGACLDPGNAARCDELRRAHDGGELFRGIAIGGYVAGGVLAVGTLVYALMPGGAPAGSTSDQGSRATPSRSLRAFVSVTPGGGGAVLQGRF